VKNKYLCLIIVKLFRVYSSAELLQSVLGDAELFTFTHLHAAGH